MRNCHKPRFGRVLEMMMATPDPNQIPAIRNDLAYQKSTIHITSVWCARWLLYLLIFFDQHYNHQGLLRSDGQVSRNESRRA